MQGKIIKGIAGFYVVEHGGRTVMCKAKGIFRKDGIKPLVGDLVRYKEAETEDSEANIEEILPRKRVLIRPAVSNVDQALVVLSVRDPDPQLFLLDEYLVVMEKQGLPAAVLWSKTDLDDGSALERYRRTYEGAGYRVLSVCTKNGEGLAELKDFLRGKTTVLAGPSGVGKSSLLNCILSEAVSETGDISRIGRGRHTTRHSEIFKIDDDTFVMDTPGYTSLELPEIDAVDLKYYYPEFTSFEGRCRFDMCTHIHEPGCAVKQAVEDGEINRWRYESYKGFFEILSDKQKR